MKDKELIKIIKERLSYDPKTGRCFWVSHSSKKMRYTNLESGYFSKSLGRVLIQINGKLYYRYRVAYILMTGKIPFLIDHINGDTSDDRWKNLRSVSKGDNQRNIDIRILRGKYLMGVRKRGNFFYARIRSNCKYIHVGSFKTEKEAHEAYIKAKIKYHGPIFRGYKNEN